MGEVQSQGCFGSISGYQLMEIKLSDDDFIYGSLAV